MSARNFLANSGGRVRRWDDPSLLGPTYEMSLSKQAGLSRGNYVVSNFLLPWLQRRCLGLTQVMVKPRCQIPKQFCANARSFRHEPSYPIASYGRFRRSVCGSIAARSLRETAGQKLGWLLRESPVLSGVSPLAERGAEPTFKHYHLAPLGQTQLGFTF